MIFDLAELGTQGRALSCDVLVIGGGTAGLIVATRLAKAGKNVVVLESGGPQESAATEELNEVVHSGMTYPGAAAGRVRCLGGTSTKWGGAMLPFEAADLAIPQELGWDAQWPISLRSLTKFQDDVESLFNLPRSSYAGPDFSGGREGVPDFVTKLAKWPPFKMRNVATLLRAQVDAANGPAIWLNATVTRFTLGDDKRLRNVVACGPGGAELTVSAPEIVLAAGALESTRLLLLLDRQHDGRLFGADDVLGRYFSDHLALYFAEIRPRDLQAFNRIVGFGFEDGGMRNLRFEASPAARRRHRLPGAYAQITFDTQAPSGFDALKSIYRSLQRRQRPALADLASLGLNAPWFSRAAWWRFVEKRVLFPPDPVFRAQLVFEQEPLPAHRITLSATRRDRFGLPLAELHWSVSRRDIDNAQALADLFGDYWRTSRASELGDIRPFSPETIRASTMDAEAFYHPGGSARLGSSAAKGVVDPQFRVYRAPNLSLVSTAAFPSGGSANPTMMLMMAGLSVAERLAAA